jgi:outer membrane protein insertion porin family
MRLAAGPSVKSSLTHTWELDTRDDRIMGRTGAYTKFAHELAGGPALRGDAAFYRAEGEYQLGRAVPYTTGMVRTHVLVREQDADARSQTWSLGARAGALVPLFGTPTLFPDRFQLGGPTNVRLFRAHSMGPRDGGQSALARSRTRLTARSGLAGGRHVLGRGAERDVRRPAQAALADQGARLRQCRPARRARPQ